MATIAVFIALGGTGYAVVKVGSGQIRDNSIRSKDVRNNGLRGKDVRNSSLAGRDITADGVSGREVLESSLGSVPLATRASDATRVGGLTPTDLKVKCPAGTELRAAVCIELGFREPAVYDQAILTCGLDQRRLPSHAELLAFLRNRPANSSGLGPGGELTASTFAEGAGSTTLLVVVIVDEGGGIEVEGDVAGDERRYRCAGAPVN